MQVPTLDSSVSVMDRMLLVPEHVRFGREEDLAFPEGNRSQPKKHHPYRAHQDGHDGV